VHEQAGGVHAVPRGVFLQVADIDYLRVRGAAHGGGVDGNVRAERCGARQHDRPAADEQVVDGAAVTRQRQVACDVGVRVCPARDRVQCGHERGEVDGAQVVRGSIAVP
jgi:hypothetical protein